MTYHTDLTGRHALVTGGGTGIGLAIAQALAQAGADVTITGRRADVLAAVSRTEPRLHPLAMDVSVAQSVQDGVSIATAARGPVSICVANAGIAEGRSVPKTDLAFWRNMMAINLDGAFLTLQACLPGMKEAGWGRGMAVSSIAGLKGLRGAAAYSASKHGLIGLIKAMAEDYAEAPYTFNALCPGYVDTPIVTRNVTAISDRAKISTDNARALMVDTNPHKRLITPQEVAAAALWLCGPHSGSVNGTSIEIAGGQI
ncbi:MAG: 3-hydroxybutyrate dehydrogenase [Paracoccaceae bacterium]|jgi:3-hydroxybutyrate dehydrogenase